MPGILIVDDHPLVRRSVRTLLTDHFMNVCGEAEDGKTAIEKASELRPDIVVLDITMPIMNGFEAAQEIRRILPLVKIVFLTLHDSAAFTINAAERMIAARLTDSNEADRAERKALKEALRVLRQLISETTPVEDRDEQFGLA